MRSFPKATAGRRQKGFSLLEVMFASTILSIFVLGIGGFWYQASTRTTELVLRQKAIFALSGELERLSALYVYTGFAADSTNGPTATTGYSDGLAALPTSRLIYPNDMNYAANDFVQSTYANFTADEFEVWAILRASSTTSVAGPQSSTCTMSTSKPSPTGWVAASNSGLAGREGRAVVYRYPPPPNGRDAVSGADGVRYSWVEGMSISDAVLP